MIYLAELIQVLKRYAAPPLQPGSKTSMRWGASARKERVEGNGDRGGWRADVRPVPTPESVVVRAGRAETGAGLVRGSDRDVRDHDAEREIVRARARAGSLHSAPWRALARR